MRCRVAFEDARKLLHQPALILDQIDPANSQQDFLASQFRKRAEHFVAMIFFVERGRNSVRLREDNLVWKLFLQQSRFAPITSDDRACPFENASRPEEPAENFPPFRAALEGFPQFLPHGFGQIQHASVNRYHKRNSPNTRHRCRDAAQAV